LDILEIFSEGNESCSHSFIYNPLSEIVFDKGLFFKTKRVCELCGRYEFVEEKMKSIRIDGYYDILNKFELEVK